MHVRIFNIYLNVIIRNIVINNWQQINILTNFTKNNFTSYSRKGNLKIL